MPEARTVFALAVAAWERQMRTAALLVIASSAHLRSRCLEAAAADNTVEIRWTAFDAKESLIMCLPNWRIRPNKTSDKSNQG